MRKLSRWCLKPPVKEALPEMPETLPPMDNGMKVTWLKRNKWASPILEIGTHLVIVEPLPFGFPNPSTSVVKTTTTKMPSPTFQVDPTADTTKPSTNTESSRETAQPAISDLKTKSTVLKFPRW